MYYVVEIPIYSKKCKKDVFDNKKIRNRLKISGKEKEIIQVELVKFLNAAQLNLLLVLMRTEKQHY